MTTENAPALTFEIATAISTGARDYQEDAILADMADGAELGLVILSDGMGGHAAGDIASKIVVTEMFNELTFRRTKMTASQDAMSAALRRAAYSANLRIAQHSELYPKTIGMGATLLCVAILGNELHWLSIGDSPLFLFRDGKLRQLNEDHSMAPQIDLMVEAGIISAEFAQSHPDRNVLTSVLCGDAIPYIDCPTKPFSLRADDVVIVASDGLQFLQNDEIGQLLSQYWDGTSHDMSDALMNALTELDDPTQDNVSLALIQIKPERDTASHWQCADWGRDSITSAPLMLIDPVPPAAANCCDKPDEETVIIKEDEGISEAGCIHDRTGADSDGTPPDLIAASAAE